MKFGKLSDISNVDFRLPPDGATNRQTLSSLPERDGPGQLFIGCTGWSMKEWVGKVYPPGTKTKDFLREYSRQFNTIELNTTHYRIPDEKTVDKWYRESTPDFRFCPKLPQSISHSKNLGLGTELIPAFCHAVEGLKEKLGCCFMQLPPYFDRQKLSQLDTFLKAFSSQIPLAIEARHDSWFGPSGLDEGLAALLKEKNVATVITDVAGRRDVLHMALTNGAAMVRFVGNGLHETDFSRIDEWISRLESWFRQGLRELFFFPHEPDNILAPELAAYVLQQAKARLPEIETRGPQLLSEEEQGEQMSLF